jgi:hypothetical protein
VRLKTFSWENVARCLVREILKWQIPLCLFEQRENKAQREW